MLIRMLVHSAVRQQDISFDFLNKKTLELKVALPQWFAFAEQMANLTVDDKGTVQFPPEHPTMTMDMTERNAERMEEDGDVYDYGYFTFDRNMVTTIDTFELLNIPIEAQNVTVRMLQFYLEVAAPEQTTPRHQRAVTHEQRTANLGTGRSGETGPANARLASERDSNTNGTGNSTSNVAGTPAADGTGFNGTLLS